MTFKWTDKDRARLKEMWERETSLDEMAEWFGISRCAAKAAVRAMRQRMKDGADPVKMKSRAGYPWSDEEMATLVRHQEAKITDLAAMLPGRGIPGIQRKLLELKQGAVRGTPVPEGVTVETTKGKPFDTPHGVPAFQKPGSNVTLVYLPSVYG